MSEKIDFGWKMLEEKLSQKIKNDAKKTLFIAFLFMKSANNVRTDNGKPQSSGI